MPTTIATIGRERTVARLARRLYQIKGRGSAELQARAEAALIAANPRLASAEGFRTGAHIVVPPVKGLLRTEEVSSADADDKGLTRETTLRLQALGSRAEDSFRRASEDRKQTLQRLNDREFVAKARAALPESVKHIEGARDRLNREEEQAAKLAKQFQNAVFEALEGVKVLDALGRKSKPG